jgi:hypothetical protein
MPILRLAILLVLTTSIARADYGAALGIAPPADATEHIRAHLRTRWQPIVDAEKTFGTWRVTFGGKQYSGQWVVRLDAWTYFVDGDKAVCTIQGGETEYLSCGSGESVSPKGRIAIAAASRQPAMSIETLRMLDRAVYRSDDLRMKIAKGAGRGTLETVLSTPEKEGKRTSKRYRAKVSYFVDGFAVEPAELVEEYEEMCFAIHGCHSTHWSCNRIR